MRAFNLILGLLIILAAAVGAEGEVSPDNPSEVDIDLFDRALTAKWDPTRLGWIQGEIWCPILSPDCYWDSDAIPIRERPGEAAEIIGGIVEDTRVRVVDGRSVWTASASPFSPEYYYAVWLKVKTEETEGWVDEVPTRPEFVHGARACWDRVIDLARVTFTETYEPLYAVPGTSYPVVREEWGREAKTGRHYSLLARCGDWYCLGRDWGGAWFPAETRGASVEYLSFVWEPREDVLFCYYLPENEVVGKIFYTFRSYYMSGSLADENPRLTIRTTAEEEFNIVPIKIRDYGFHETSQGDYEAVLITPIKSEEIESITFAVGGDGERIQFTVDPREAWAEYDAER